MTTLTNDEQTRLVRLQRKAGRGALLKGGDSVELDRLEKKVVTSVVVEGRSPTRTGNTSRRPATAIRNWRGGGGR